MPTAYDVLILRADEDGLLLLEFGRLTEIDGIDSLVGVIDSGDGLSSSASKQGLSVPRKKIQQNYG